MKKCKRILSIDPGKKNLAFSIVTSKPNIEYVGLIEPSLIMKTKYFKDTLKEFKQQLIEIIEKTKYDSLIIERYLTRRRDQNIEFINIIIGMFLSLSKNPVLITPAQWKVYMNKKYKTNVMTDLLKNKIHRYKTIFNYTISEHEADAIGIGIYYIEKMNNISILKKLQSKKWGFLSE